MIRIVLSLDMHRNQSAPVITSQFITNAGLASGVAWDGRNFWTSNVFNGSVSEWSSTGALHSDGVCPLIEGMSFNLAQTVGTPEPGTLVVFGTGIVGLAGLLRRKFLA
jgi:hypothetical protein